MLYDALDNKCCSLTSLWDNVWYQIKSLINTGIQFRKGQIDLILSLTHANVFISACILERCSKGKKLTNKQKTLRCSFFRLSVLHCSLMTDLCLWVAGSKVCLEVRRLLKCILACEGEKKNIQFSKKCNAGRLVC